MKSVLISIQPKYCELIASGKKTIEVRKTAPNLKTPFKCYIYATKPKHFVRGYPNDALFRHIDGEIECGFSYSIVVEKGAKDRDNFLSGKVIGEFVCDKVMRFNKWGGWLSGIENYDISFDHLKETCLDGLWEYGKGKPLYGWHISDLKIYDKPKELSEFRVCCEGRKCFKCKRSERKLSSLECSQLNVPPQSWCYVES